MKYFLFVLFVCIGSLALAQEDELLPDKEIDSTIVNRLKELDTRIVSENKKPDSTSAERFDALLNRRKNELDDIISNKENEKDSVVIARIDLIITNKKKEFDLLHALRKRELDSSITASIDSTITIRQNELDVIIVERKKQVDTLIGIQIDSTIKVKEKEIDLFVIRRKKQVDSIIASRFDSIISERKLALETVTTARKKELDTTITPQLDATIVQKEKELDFIITARKKVFEAQNAPAKKRKKRGREREATYSDDSITIQDYKIISFARDTTFLDTTLTIQKEYKYNYLRKDDFELMPFANVGQPYNKLGVDLRRKDQYPRIGAKAKHFNYEEVWDINYYNVPKPLSDLFFKTTFEQGQLLDARLTFNTSRRLNFSLSFKGHRSLGKYSTEEVQSGNFRATTNYETRNGRYMMRAHTAAQSIETEENGGLSLKEVQFESGDPQFQDRSRLDVRFIDADSKLSGRRYFLDQQYKLLRKLKDSDGTEKTSFAIGHQFNYETKIYDYFQTVPDEYYGDSFLSAITDRARLKTMFNQGNITFSNSVLGRLQANVNLYNYNYYFNSILVTDDGPIDSQLKGEEVSVGANYEKVIKGFDIKGAAQYNISGNLTGTLIDASAGYRINENNGFRVGIHSSNRMPNFNFLLYQSDYSNYNWQNSDSFEKESVNSLFFNFDSKLLGSLSANYSAIDNYTYFAADANDATQAQLDAGLFNAYIKPAQETNSLKHLKVKYNKEFRLGKFALNNTVMYQNVAQTNQVLNVPELVTRNTLYFSSEVFKKAMFLQTGITFKYFTEYTMDSYNPVLGEFYIQNTEKLGGYPLLDFFINAKVQQTRIYLKAEHFNSFFGDNNFYAAPDYPYRDFVIRFGLVWNFFS